MSPISLPDVNFRLVCENTGTVGGKKPCEYRDNYWDRVSTSPGASGIAGTRQRLGEK